MNTNTKTVSVQARALYCGERVDVLDVMVDSYTGKTEYMINYGGPVWVDASWLSQIVWVI